MFETISLPTISLDIDDAAMVLVVAQLPACQSPTNKPLVCTVPSGRLDRDRQVVGATAPVASIDRAWRHTFSRGTMRDGTHSASPALGEPDWLLTLITAPVHLLRAVIDGQLAGAGESRPPVGQLVEINSNLSASRAKSGLVEGSQ